MEKIELLKKINSLKCDDLTVIVRGENCIADISDVYVDTNHSDESEFISIDLENET